MNILGAIFRVLGLLVVTLWFASPLISVGYFIAYFMSSPSEPVYLVIAVTFFLIALTLLAAWIYQISRVDWKSETNGRLFSSKVKWPAE